LVDAVDPKGFTELDDPEMTVLQYEFKADLNAYLARLGDKTPVKTLDAVIEFNDRNKDKEMPYFGQDLLVKANAKGPLTDKDYLDARATCLKLAKTEGIDAIMEKDRLDALVAPTGGAPRATAPAPRDPFTR